jgi:arylsulfatase A-like enzyme
MDSPPRPNVIWIFGDQHRAQSLGCAGDPNVHTPNFDRLATEGAYFPRALSGAPLCCPARGSILTSRYPHECVPGHERPLPPEMPTIAHTLRENHYRTMYFGKWHLDGFHEREGRGAFHIVPEDRRGGFEEWLGYENNNSPFDSWVHGVGQPEPRQLDGFETDALTDLLITRLEKRHTAGDDAPFFAVLSVQPPHNPYVAPEEWMGRHSPARVELRANVPRVPSIESRARRDLAGYHAMIENLDANIGRLRSALSRLHLADNTFLMVFSDHGDMHGSHGQFLKTSPWEESIRVPFLIGGGIPYYVQKRATCDAPLNHVDIAPTTLGLCGVAKPSSMHGCDYSSWFLHGRAGDGEPDSAYLQMVEATGHPDSVDRPWRGLVTRDGWKYVCLEHQPWLMFHLSEDPLEQVNLAHNTRFVAERRRLHRRLESWIQETRDTFPLPAIS